MVIREVGVILVAHSVEVPMAELETEFHYKGHDIAITLVEREGAWHWSYVMDATSRFELQQLGWPSSEAAHLEAIRDAKERIDRLP
jgi:hypothetical protein